MLKIKKDRFYKNRGGNAQILKIICSNCHYFVASYQKDGSGKLLRMYFDRILYYNSISENLNDKKLFCPNCKNTIGIGFVYKVEKRRAFRLIKGSFKKK